MTASLHQLRRKFALSGLVVAGIGFFLTRFTVTLAAYDDPMQFVVAGVVPLVLGLSLAAFGVALVVGDFDHRFVRTVTGWCVAGATSMLVLVVLTLLGGQGSTEFMSARSQAYLSNFLIGGSVGGALTGIYAGQSNTQQRKLRQQTNRLVMVNRLLRDKVLNAVTVIDGRAELARSRSEPSESTLDAIKQRSGDVQTTIENVKHITNGVDGPRSLDSISVVSCIEAAVETVRERFPAARYSVDIDIDRDVTVWGNPLLEHVVTDLVENAVAYSDAERPAVEVRVTSTDDHVRVAVADNGPGLPERQQELIASGEIAEYADRSTGFGLNFVRLLAESYGADVDATVTEEGTTITLALPRSDIGRSMTTTTTTHGIPHTETALTVGAAFVAGVVMGIVFQAVAGSVPIIGALYGVTSFWVGWITHQFHSIVFGLVYAGLVTLVPGEYSDRIRYYGVAIAWSLLLWLVASGLIMPVWLRLVGFDASLPNLSALALGGHLLWGLSLAVLYHLGSAWLDR